MVLNLAIVVGLLGLAYMVMGLGYPMGSLARPGPGIFPVFVGILLLLGCVGTGFEAISKPAPTKVDWPKGKERWRILAVISACLIYSVTLLVLGHLLSTTVVISVVLHVMGIRSWFLKIGMGLAIGLGTLYLFSNFLGVPLPKGIIPFV